MQLVGSIVEQTQRLLDRPFFLSAYVPTAVIALAVWVQLDGVGPVWDALQALADDSASEAVVTVGLALIGLYLVAFVIHGLRRSLRQVWGGAVPFRLLREALVTRNLARHNRLRDRLEALAEQRTAARWMLNDFADEQRGFVPRPPSTRAEIDRTRDRCARTLRALDRRGALFAVERAHRFLCRLWRLAAADDEAGRTSRLIEQVRSHGGDSRVRRRLIAARLRIEQRFHATDAELELAYPPEDGLQGTALGNVLARTEHYSTVRYGIPLSELWPRLRLIADERALAEADDALVRVDFAVTLCTGAVVVAATGLVLVLAGGPSPEPVWVGLGAVLVAITMYRFAVAAAHIYGGQVAAVVDLHLDALAEALPDPKGTDRDWNSIYHFLARADTWTGGDDADDDPDGPPAPTGDP